MKKIILILTLASCTKPPCQDIQQENRILTKQLIDNTNNFLYKEQQLQEVIKRLHIINKELTKKK